MYPPKDDIAEQWKSFDPERRDRLLKRMTPEQKKRLRAALEPSAQAVQTKFDMKDAVPLKFDMKNAVPIDPYAATAETSDPYAATAEGATQFPPTPLSPFAYHPSGTDGSPAGSFADTYLRPVGNTGRAAVQTVLDTPGALWSAARAAVSGLPQSMSDLIHPMDAHRHAVEATTQRARERHRGEWMASGVGFYGVLRGVLHGSISDVGEAILLGGSTYAASEGVGSFLSRPGVQEWLSRPEPRDLVELQRLPPEQRAAVAEALRPVLADARSKGIKVAPALAVLAGVRVPKTPAKPRGE